MNHEVTKDTKKSLYVRRVKRRTYIVSSKGQSLLCVPCAFMVQKREYVTEVNNVPETPIYRGNGDRAKFPHGYVAEKTNPGASELKKAHRL